MRNSALFLILMILTLPCASEAQQRSTAQTDDVVWTAGADAPETLFKAATGVIWPYWYGFGGEMGWPAIAYNIVAERWEESTYPLQSGNNWCGVATDSALYIVGHNSGLSYYDTFQRFTPSNGGPEGEWTILPHYPLSLCGAAVAWDGGNYLYASGGEDADSIYRNAYKFDIENDWWIEVASCPAAMSFHGAAFVNGKFYAMGGVDSPWHNYEYDPATDTWLGREDLPEPVYFGFSAVTHNDNYIIVAGGGSGIYIWPASNVVQVYDPLTNSWTLETSLPQNGLGNNCIDYIGEDLVISTGGWLNAIPTTQSWIGSGFPGGTPHPVFDVTVDVSTTGAVVIPETGGQFDYSVTLTSSSPGFSPFEYWVMILFPDSSWLGPVFDPVFYHLPEDSVVAFDSTQIVPGNAPGGAYLLEAYVGDYPDDVWDSSTITFEKDDGVGIALEQSADQFALVTVYPNPFNPTAVISYELRVTGSVLLNVYDIQGRLVATLVDGYRNAGLHEVTFDASGLASGVYLYSLEVSGEAPPTYGVGKMLLVK
ncbi:MAG: kelch repeat-containing protein [bacterium]